MIKAIETRYKGYRFRSRLEARWAVFFDALQLRWGYEPEGYSLPSGAYLPDFYLPELGIFVEIKGVSPTDDEIEKARELRDHSKRAVFVAVGLPYENPGMLFCWDTTDSSGGSYERSATWLFHRKRPSAIIHGDWRIGDRRDIFAGYFCDRINASDAEFLGGFRPQAWDAARSARFEHGELPQ